MLKSKVKDEQGFSLLEMVIAVAIMGILVTVGMLYSAQNGITTAYKTSLKSDLTAVAIELSGWNLNNTEPPTPQEFMTMKNRVLSDYLAVTNASELEANTTYVNGIGFVKLNGYYCVEGTKIFPSKTYTMHYDSATSKVADGACPLS